MVLRFVPMLMLALGAALPYGVAAQEAVETKPEAKPWQGKPYGFLNAEVEYADAKGGATPYRGRGRVSDGNSRIGLQGSFDLRQNLKALWQIEGGLAYFDQGGVNDQGRTTTLVSRNTFVGMEHLRFGRLVIGSNESAYRSLVGSAGELGGNLGLTVTGLDVWTNTSAQLSGSADSVFSRGEDRYRNSAHYDSPDIRGFRGALSYAFDETLAAGRSRDRYALALRYARGPFKLGVGHEHRKNTGVNLESMRQGLGFHVGAEDGVATNFYKALVGVALPTKTYLGAGYEYVTYGFSDFLPPSPDEFNGQLVVGKMKQHGAMASIAQGILNRTTIMASAGKLWSLRGAPFGAWGDYAAWQASLGAKFAFNEHVTGYIYATEIHNGPTQNLNLGQSPIYSNQLGTANAYLAPGNHPRALGMGLLTRF